MADRKDDREQQGGQDAEREQREAQERKERAEREQRERTDQERERLERERDDRDAPAPVVGALGATPKLSSDPRLVTTPVTVTGEQAGGTVLLDTGHVAYTNEGAVSAVPNGPLDPTIIPGQFEDAPAGTARVMSRASVPGARSGER
jgi:septal ring factor EnvC (AmiA/AmiB activator)